MIYWNLRFDVRHRITSTWNIKNYTALSVKSAAIIILYTYSEVNVQNNFHIEKYIIDNYYSLFKNLKTVKVFNIMVSLDVLVWETLNKNSLI